jgi:hypothetical protein
MAARKFRCGHKVFTRTRSPGRNQQAHHQSIVFETEIMEFS